MYQNEFSSKRSETGTLKASTPSLSDVNKAQEAHINTKSAAVLSTDVAESSESKEIEASHVTLAKNDSRDSFILDSADSVDQVMNRKLDVINKTQVPLGNSLIFLYFKFKIFEKNKIFCQKNFIIFILIKSHYSNKK